MPDEQPAITTPAAAPATVNIDSVQLAEALGRVLVPALQHTVQAAHAASRGPEPDPMQAMIDQISERAEDGRITVADAIALMNVHGEQLSKRQQGEMWKMIKGQRDADAVAMIDAEIERYAKHDELIAENRELIRHKVIKDFNESDEYKAVRVEHDNGVKHPHIAAALVKKYVDRQSKAAGREVKEGTSATTKAVTATASSTTQKQLDASSASRDQLSDGQGELYASHYSLLMRSGYKPEDAHKEAMSAAVRRKR